MKRIFVNLKRFDVPKSMGGICQMDNPKLWIEWVVDESVKHGIGQLEKVEVTFLLPESLIIPAVEKLASYPASQTKSIKIGCQGVYREDVTKGGNFGAFTTNRPAAAAKNLGCGCSIIGHSEERKDKLGIIVRYDPDVIEDKVKRNEAKKAVDAMINEEVLCALNAGMTVLLCIGESAGERGEGCFEEQRLRVEAVLGAQLEAGLHGVETKQPQNNVIIGYEPIWAIGPGKIPPGADYISFVADFIRKFTAETFGFGATVVYGGGLKEENAGMIAGIDSVGGGLVALTKFVGEIGFYPDDLRKIIAKYME
jgi:triosephosphate isomerase